MASSHFFTEFFFLKIYSAPFQKLQLLNSASFTSSFILTLKCTVLFLAAGCHDYIGYCSTLVSDLGCTVYKRRKGSSDSIKSLLLCKYTSEEVILNKIEAHGHDFSWIYASACKDLNLYSLLRATYPSFKCLEINAYTNKNLCSGIGTQTCDLKAKYSVKYSMVQKISSGMNLAKLSSLSERIWRICHQNSHL